MSTTTPKLSAERFSKELSSHEEALEQQYDMLPNWLRDAPWWATSALLHVLLILLIGGVLITTETGTEEIKEAAIIALPYEVPPYDPKPPRGIETTANAPLENDEHSVTRNQPNEITPDIPKGSSFENMSDTELNSTGMVNTFGPGGGRSGAFGRPTGVGVADQIGGPKRAQCAVEAALRWLVRHQNPDGSWSCHDWPDRCNPATGKCCFLKNHPDPMKTAGKGTKLHDIGVTALAMLAFTGYGHTHQFGIHPEFVETLKKAVKFLKSVQITGTGNPNLDGCFRRHTAIPKDKSQESLEDEKQGWMYDHSIATMAMAELLAMTGDTIGLKTSVESGARFCLRSQNDGWGWRYSVKSPDNDTSITGWMVLALKTIKVCRIMGFVNSPTDQELATSFQGALNWFNHATSDITGITGYRSPGDQGSRLANLDALSTGYPYSKKLSCMTAVGVLCRIFSGESRKSKAVQQGVTVLMRELPLWRKQSGKALSTINFYYWYYGSFALFQYGGGAWNRWNQAMQDALLNTQRQVGDSKDTGGCEDGSWDPIGEWGVEGGRVYTTAMGALTLEVFYRYRRIKKGSNTI